MSNKLIDTMIQQAENPNDMEARQNTVNGTIGRRSFFKKAGVLGIGAAFSALLTGCAEDISLKSISQIPQFAVLYDDKKNQGQPTLVFVNDFYSNLFHLRSSYLSLPNGEGMWLKQGDYMPVKLSRSNWRAEMDALLATKGLNLDSVSKFPGEAQRNMCQLVGIKYNVKSNR